MEACAYVELRNMEARNAETELRGRYVAADQGLLLGFKKNLLHYGLSLAN